MGDFEEMEDLAVGCQPIDRCILLGDLLPLAVHTAF